MMSNQADGGAVSPRLFGRRSVLVLALPLGAAEPVKNPDTFVYLNQTGTTSFDPHWANDSPSAAVNANVYETLLTFNGPGLAAKDLAPLLAEQVPTRANKLLSEDGLTYRFPIRKGVKFHDGTTMGAYFGHSRHPYRP